MKMLRKLTDSFHRSVLLNLVKLRAWRTTTDVVSYNDYWNTVKRCMISWSPGIVDNAAVNVIIEKLKTRFPSLKTVLVILPGTEDQSLYSDMEVIKLTEESIQWTGRPSSDIRKRLALLEMDLIIDLSPDFDVFSAYICQLTKAPVKIGFATKYSDLVYNYQIMPKSTTDILERYRVLARYIG